MNNQSKNEQWEILRKNPIGEILTQFQKIAEEDIERILDFQNKNGRYFGEAAVKLGLAGKEDVELALAYQFSYPYLGKNENTVSKKVVAAYSPFAPEVEAVKNIRTALLLARAGGEIKSICVTGCRDRIGEIFVGVNLAVVFAQLGHKTLLLDFNMRTPTIHKLFQKNNSSGVSTLLIKRSTLKEAIKPTPFEKLDILPGGPLPPNPLELIIRKEARQLMESLKEAYEIIIVRTPSFEQTADISFLASFMDGILMVVLKKKTTRNEIEKARKLLERASARLLGVVLKE